jgi:hypothetical protein
MEMQPTDSDKRQHHNRRQPIPAFTPSPINVSTPPVRIVDSEPRLRAGHYLSDR